MRSHISPTPVVLKVGIFEKDNKQEDCESDDTHSDKEVRETNFRWGTSSSNCNYTGDCGNDTSYRLTLKKTPHIASRQNRKDTIGTTLIDRTGN